MNSNTEKQMGMKTCSDVTNLSPVFSFLDHRLACDGGLSAKDRGIGFTISCFEIYAASDCAAMASLSMALAPFQGMSRAIPPKRKRRQAQQKRFTFCLRVITNRLSPGAAMAKIVTREPWPMCSCKTAHTSTQRSSGKAMASVHRLSNIRMSSVG